MYWKTLERFPEDRWWTLLEAATAYRVRRGGRRLAAALSESMEDEGSEDSEIEIVEDTMFGSKDSYPMKTPVGRPVPSNSSSSSPKRASNAVAGPSTSSSPSPAVE